MAGEVFPIGTVLFFVGAWTDNVTMVGWYKCDGGSDPDIMNNFVRGAGTSGAGGGSDAALNIVHQHSGISTKANHNHGGATGGSDPATHTHEFNAWYWKDFSGLAGNDNAWINSYTDNILLYNWGGLHAHFSPPATPHYTYNGSHAHATAASGAGGAGKNMPEYKAAIPIIRRV